MGNNKSKQSSGCNECNCASEVPRVIAECNKAGSKAVSSTFEQTVTGLVGKKNSDFIMNEYNSALGDSAMGINDCPNNKWCSDYKNIISTFNNLDTFSNREGFIEGNKECIPSDCKQAADEIIEDCKTSTQEVPNAIGNLAETIQPSFNNLLGPIMDSAQGTKTETKETNDDWKNIFRPNIEKVENAKKENFSPFITNAIEGLENQGLYQFTRQALASRHATFKNTSTFEEDCRNNSYTSIKDFIIQEKKILDSLYNYYSTFVKDYESLYLHKESFSKTIYNKLDELEKIQTKIDSYKTNLHVDNRKNLYQSNNYDFYINIRFYILIVYYSVLIVYLIFSKFFSEKQYTNKVLVLLLFLYLIMPIILGHLINFAYEGYIYFLEYNNIKEDTKSYEDIINKNIT
jgi:hypothetical protein